MKSFDGIELQSQFLILPEEIINKNLLTYINCRQNICNVHRMFFLSFFFFKLE